MGVTDHMAGVATGLVGVATGLVGVADHMVGVTTGLVGVTDHLVGVATGLVGVTDHMVGVATVLVGVANHLVSVADWPGLDTWIWQTSVCRRTGAGTLVRPPILREAMFVVAGATPTGTQGTPLQSLHYHQCQPAVALGWPVSRLPEVGGTRELSMAHEFSKRRAGCCAGGLRVPRLNPRPPHSSGCGSL